MRLYTEEPGAEQFARPVLDWRRKGRPLRRPYGKKRPLGISEGNDKLLQEVVRTILETIYEPIFEESSHGFRPGRSPHTALEGIKHEWQAVKWLVDMDLRSYFDTINHDLLMGFLQKKIGDTRFLRLIKAMLDAGSPSGLDLPSHLQRCSPRLNCLTHPCQHLSARTRSVH